MTIKEHYEKVGETSSAILSESIKEENLEIISPNHSFISDFDIWLEVLETRPEFPILKNAIKEYQIALTSNLFGMYQQAFMGLRFFLERTLVAILFSGKEIDLNLWKIGERDTYWSEILDQQNGIYSPKFCKAFFPALKEELPHFNAVTLKVYRECSEYVHGNNAVIDKIPDNLEYSVDLFKEWNAKANVIIRIVQFALCLRYLNTMISSDKAKLSASLQEEFNSIAPISTIVTN